MQSQGISLRRLAADLGWSLTTTSRRFNGVTPFTVDEFVAVTHYLDLDPAELLPSPEQAA